MKQNLKSILQASRTVYDFPYFENESGKGRGMRLFFLRLLLCCVLCGSGMALVAKELGIDTVDFVQLISLCCGLCAFFYAIFGLLGTWRGLVTAGIAGAVLCYIFRESIYVSAVRFWNHIMRLMDGSVFSTSSLIVGRYNWGYSSFREGADTFLMYLSVLAALITVMCTRRRFYASTPGAFFCLLCLPALLSGKMKFYPELLIFITAMVFFAVTESSAGASAKLSYGSRGFLYVQDKQFNKKNKRNKPVPRLARENEYYGKFISTGVTAAVSTMLVLAIVSSMLPPGAKLDMSDTINKACQFFSDVGYKIGSIFSGSPLISSGFFSQDIQGSNEIRISGDIDDPTSPRAESVVLRVTVEDKEQPLYLRGDIGYSYFNESWKSIAGLDFDKSDYYYYGYYADRDTYYNKYISANDIFDSNYPDSEMKALRLRFAQYYESAGDYIGFQKVNIEYLKKTRTIFMPAYPFETGFRDSDVYHTTGDFISWVDRAGAVDSFELLTLYPKINGTNFLDAVAAVCYDKTNYKELDTLAVSGLEPYDFESMQDAYLSYVNDIYTEVPEPERQNIRQLIQQWEKIDPSSSDLMVLSEDYALYRVDSLCRYLNGSLFNEMGAKSLYKYSIDADNDRGDNTYLGNFLFDTHEGHCALYATAMTLAVRELGLPARYVTGFVVNGEPDKSTDEGWEFDIRQRQLHAWVEVYFEGIGWLTFDPTPPSPFNFANPGTGSVWSTETATSSPATEPEESTTATTTEVSTTTEDTTITTAKSSEITTTQPSGSSGTDKDRQDSADIAGIILKVLAVIAALGVILLIVLWIAGFLRRLEKNRRAMFNNMRSGDITVSMRRMLTLILKLLKLMKIKRLPGETPMDLAVRTDSAIKLPCKLEAVMPYFEHTEFQKEQKVRVTEEQRVLAYEFVKALTDKVLEAKGLRRLVIKIKLFRRVKNY